VPTVVSEKNPTFWDDPFAALRRIATAICPPRIGVAVETLFSCDGELNETCMREIETLEQQHRALVYVFVRNRKDANHYRILLHSFQLSRWTPVRRESHRGTAYIHVFDTLEQAIFWQYFRIKAETYHQVHMYKPCDPVEQPEPDGDA
jgi:hypothetical protein